MKKQPARGVRRAGTPLIYRQVSFDLPAFDLLKQWQRYFQRREETRLTNSEVMCRLILNNPPPQ